MDLAPDALTDPKLLFRLLAGVGLGDGCWLRSGKGSRGYSYFHVAVGDLRPAHRVAYELFIGPIPEGYDVDHLCHNADLNCKLAQSCPHRRCCNPSHLEAVPHAENLRRGRRCGLQERTHCKNGHEFTTANTYNWVDRKGRQCKLCARQRAREQYLSRRTPRRPEQLPLRLGR